MPRTSEMIESNYLKKEDFDEDGMIVTVSNFKKVNVAQEGQPPEHKWCMYFEEFEKPMVLNSTNIQLAEKAFGSDNTDDWLGKEIIVYVDPNVSFGGKIVGGLRLRAHRKASGPRAAPRQPTQRDVEADFGDDVPFDPR